MTHAERNKALVQTFIEAANARNWEKLALVVSPGFVRHSYAGGYPAVRSRDDLVTFLLREYETFPDGKETIEDLVAEGNKVAARHRFRGTQKGLLGPYPPSGKVMMADYIAIYRLEGELIVEAWAEWDNLSGLIQLGHYKPTA
jgi:predicted ester cyclase